MTTKKHFAGFMPRMFAWILDYIFLLPAVLVSIYLTGNHELATFGLVSNSFTYKYLGMATYNSFANYISYAVTALYVFYFLSSKKQATPGQRIMGIYVGNPDGSRLSPAKAMARAAAAILTTATMGFGFLLVLFNKEKRALHDFLCNTRVFFGKK